MGDIPDKFTSYWNSRFPLLLLHSWLSMQCVKEETTFRQYYHTSFQFPELTFKDTCYLNSTFDHYSSYSCNYIDDETNENIDQNDKLNLADNSEFWAKKSKPKYERNVSPKKYNNSRRFMPSPTSNDTHLRNHILNDSETKSIPKERNHISFKQHRHQDTQSSKPNFNHKKKNTSKINHRQVEEPVIWSLPAENKKIQ